MRHRISIGVIREWTRHPPHWIDAPVGPDEVAALLAVAEAAREAEVGYGEIDDEYFSAIRDALARFDFGDEPA